jgi:hypothetical protein
MIDLELPKPALPQALVTNNGKPQLSSIANILLWLFALPEWRDNVCWDSLQRRLCWGKDNDPEPKSLDIQNASVDLSYQIFVNCGVPAAPNEGACEKAILKYAQEQRPRNLLREEYERAFESFLTWAAAQAGPLPTDPHSYSSVPSQNASLVSAAKYLLGPLQAMALQADEPHAPHALIRWSISRAARAYVPGAPVKAVLCLEGERDYYKSTWCSLMGGNHYGSSLGDLTRGVAAEENIQGKSLVEIPELQGFTRADQRRIKEFLGKNVDHFRGAYGRQAEDNKRTAAFVITTNEVYDYLTDVTGNTHVWPLRCLRPIDLKWFTEHRQAILGASACLYKAKESWWLTDEEKVLIAEARTLRETDEVVTKEASDPWYDKIHAWLKEQPEPVNVNDVLERACLVGRGDITDREQKRCARLLRRLGCVTTRKSTHRLWQLPR